MDGVQGIFSAWVLLAAALWIVWPVLGAGRDYAVERAVVADRRSRAWSFLGPGGRAFSVWRRLGRGIGAALAIWAAVLLVGLAAGSSDPLRPLAVLAARGSGDAGVASASNKPNTASQSDLTFASVRSSTELDEAVKNRSSARYARFLRRLVRELQRDGEVHVQRSARFR